MIKCSRCGAELSEDTKFCSYCGNKIEVTTPPPIKEDIISSGTFQTEQTKPNVKKSDAPKSVVDKIKEKASAKWHEMSTYGKIATVAISIFVLLCLVAFIANANILLRFCSLIETGIFIVAAHNSVESSVPSGGGAFSENLQTGCNPYQKSLVEYSWQPYLPPTLPASQYLHKPSHHPYTVP